MKLHYLLIGIVVVSMFSLGIISFISDLSANYSKTANLDGFEETQTRLEIQQQNAQDLSDEITEFKLESVGDFFDIPYKMIKISWKLVKSMFSSWVTVGEMTAESVDELSNSGIPIPSWVLGSIIALIVIIISAIITYAWFKWEFQT